MDWGKTIEGILQQSPLWGPFLIALGMIMFFVVKPLLNGVRDTQVTLAATIGGAVTAINNLSLIVQKVADSQNAILVYLAPHTALITPANVNAAEIKKASSGESL